ncbi:MAG: hypothetical protein LBJ74_01890, partial [Heliobacteriaceae bacterium]|nr:hypothetical protein [Heliobacteriaceae bacterium]
MKVHSNTASGINFEGYKPFKNEVGKKGYVFSYPFDSEKYECCLEVYKVRELKDKDGYNTGNYSIGEQYSEFKLEPSAKFTLNGSHGIPDDKPFAYRYRLREKGGSNMVYITEAGTVIKSSRHTCNLVSPNGIQSSETGGSMKLCFWDTYAPQFEYDKKGGIQKRDIEHLKSQVKYFSAKAGGSLAGLEKSIETGKLNGYSKIIGTPVFTDDSLTDHAYWNKNCFQTAQSLGSINNYASVQRKMFAKGINFVNDGAFVNEGLEGIHFKHVMKWGKESPYYNWFRVRNEDGYLTLGVLPDVNELPKEDRSAVEQNISHCLVNSPFLIEEKKSGIYSTDKKNPYYERTKPTYIQIYDKRLMYQTALNRDERIKTYDKSAPDDPFAINNRQDSVLPYSFEIDPQEYKDNVENIINKNKIPLDTLKGTKMAAQF